MTRPDTALRGMDVVVLAGGMGSRIRAVLGDTPKVLAPVGDRPFLAYLLDRLALLGAGRVILSLGVLADKVTAYLAAHPHRLPIASVIETAPLGTAGGLRLASAQTSTDPVLVINGDTWLETNYHGFVDTYFEKGRDISILCIPVEDCARYGRVDLDDSGAIIGFVEKSTVARGPGLISGGVYLFSQSALAELRESCGPSLEQDFFAARQAGGLTGYRADTAVFLDIGTPESLAAAPSVMPADRRAGFP